VIWIDPQKPSGRQDLRSKLERRGFRIEDIAVHDFGSAVSARRRKVSVSLKPRHFEFLTECLNGEGGGIQSGEVKPCRHAVIGKCSMQNCGQTLKRLTMRRDREIRRRIIREWMSLPHEKRLTLEQAATFAVTVEANSIRRSRKGPRHTVMVWLSPRVGRG
jgi:hypothetical protein